MARTDGLGVRGVCTRNLSHATAVSSRRPSWGPITTQFAKCLVLRLGPGKLRHHDSVLERTVAKITGIDLFCGAGGSSAGAFEAGVAMIGAIDMCPIATATYAANFTHAFVKTNRLQDVDVTLFRREVGTVDIVLASPECTNHTCAKGARPINEGSRETAMLPLAYIELFRPRWVVFENVIHIRPWIGYQELKDALTALGYRIAEQVLDAADFGVAQNRRRLFLVGDAKREPRTVAEKRRGRRRTVKSILDASGTWPVSPLRSPSRAEPTLERASRGIQAVGKLTPFLLVYYGSDGSGGWQHLDRPLRTITTVDRFALVEPSIKGHTIRMLQVPELKKAMGFPPEYELAESTRRERVKLLGNGVCPPVMEAVVRALTA